MDQQGPIAIFRRSKGKFKFIINMILFVPMVATGYRSVRDWLIDWWRHVQSIVLVVFREGKAEEEELKFWQLWHSRQHSIKQHILDIGRW